MDRVQIIESRETILNLVLEAQRTPTIIFPIAARIKKIIGQDEEKPRSLVLSLISLLKTKDLFLEDKQVAYLADAIKSNDAERTLILASRSACLLFAQAIVDARFDDPFSINKELLNSIAAEFLENHIVKDSDASSDNYNVFFTSLLIKNSVQASLAGIGHSITSLAETREAIERERNEASEFHRKWKAETDDLKEKSEKLKALVKKKKMGIGIEALAASFEAFRRRKIYESCGALAITITFSVGAIAIPAVFLFSSIIPAIKTPLDAILHIIPGAGIELLLVYFMRLSFSHFKSVQAQLLQIDLRIASTNFIRDYTDFKKENETANLERFEKLIFSGVVADHERTPHTFDGLTDLANLIKAAKEPRN